MGKKGKIKEPELEEDLGMNIDDMPSSSDLKILKKVPKNVKIGTYFQIKAEQQVNEQKKYCSLVTFKVIKKEGMGKFRIVRKLPCNEE